MLKLHIFRDGQKLALILLRIDSHDGYICRQRCIALESMRRF